jgi:hypothetical protein
MFNSSSKRPKRAGVYKNTFIVHKKTGRPGLVVLFVSGNSPAFIFFLCFGMTLLEGKFFT